MKTKKYFLIAVGFIATASIAIFPVNLGAMDYYMTSDRYNADTITISEIVDKIENFDFSSISDNLSLNQKIENEPSIWKQNYESFISSDFVQSIKDNLTVENFKTYLNKGLEFFNPTNI